MSVVVRIRIDRQFYAVGDGLAHIHIIQIQAIPIGVDFQRGSGALRRFYHAIHIEHKTFAARNEAIRWMPNDIDIRILHSGNCSRRRILFKGAVNGSDDKIELLIIGDVFGEAKLYLENKIEEYKLHNSIRRTGWLPYNKVSEAISHADIGIIFMEPTENNMLAGPPNKLFNYMRYGLPVVSFDLPETSRIISETQGGIIIRDRSVDSLVRALSSLIEDEANLRRMGERGREAVLNYYNWEHMEAKLLRIYQELLED